MSSPRAPVFPAENKLGDGTAVESESHVLHNIKNPGVRECLHGKIFAKFIDLGKGLDQGAPGFTNSGLVVYMKRGAEMAAISSSLGNRRSSYALDIGMIGSPSFLTPFSFPTQKGVEDGPRNSVHRKDGENNAAPYGMRNDDRRQITEQPVKASQNMPATAAAPINIKLNDHM